MPPDLSGIIVWMRAPEHLIEPLRQWDLGPVRAVMMTPLGTMNETYVVTLADRQVVLRCHLTRDLDAVSREHALIRYVNEQGIPVPQAVPARHGQTFASVDDRLYSLFEHAPGRQVSRTSLSMCHAYELGSVLARVHAVLVDATPVRSRANGSTSDKPAEYTVEHLELLLDLILSRSVRSASDDWAAERLRSRLAYLKGHICVAPAEMREGCQTTHGDFQESNVFFDPHGGICAVIDWEKSVRQPRAFELVRTMALCLELDPPRSSELLRGYRGLGDVSDEELDRAADAVRLAEAARHLDLRLGLPPR